MARIDGRANNQLRPTLITPGVQAFAEGSALIEQGRTKIICTVSVEEKVPRFLRGTGRGWITAEYAMLPRSTSTRTPRDSFLGRTGGRNQEIQRIIGRSLRAITSLDALGEISLIVDCDVLQADGGTRTAAITGSYVALVQAVEALMKKKMLPFNPLRSAVAAVSVGAVQGEVLLDLCYEEDFHAEVDFNVAMTSAGRFVEVQGTAEEKPFSGETMDALLGLARVGIKELFKVQDKALKNLKGGDK
ncbi:MAG: ribonuclease PH [Dehalococcoidia bacterium]